MNFNKLMGHKYSEIAGEEVAILKYTSKDRVPYCQCSRCGKNITRAMYVVQSRETDVELFYLGPCCYKHFM